MSTLVTTISLIIALGLSVCSDISGTGYYEPTQICGGPEGSSTPPPQH